MKINQDKFIVSTAKIDAKMWKKCKIINMTKKKINEKKSC